MIVVDASAVVDALATQPRDEPLFHRLSSDEWASPHLLDVEFLHALRRMVRRGELSPDRAEQARVDYDHTRIERFPHGGLVDRMWELRHNVTAYDAAYLALSEVLAKPLVTTDGRLARSSGHRARIELFEPEQPGALPTYDDR